MAHTQLNPAKATTYFFLKSKDVQIENGLATVTLFARLAREVASTKGKKKETLSETSWVQIVDIRMEHVTEKVRNLPNCMQKYEVSDKIFYHLLELSESCTYELYGVTPYYLTTNRKMFVPWQELEKNWPKSGIKDEGELVD